MGQMQTNIICKLKIDRNIIFVPRQVLYSSLSLILRITLLSGSRAGLVSVILTVVFYHHWWRSMSQTSCLVQVNNKWQPTDRTNYRTNERTNKRTTDRSNERTNERRPDRPTERMTDTPTDRPRIYLFVNSMSTRFNATWGGIIENGKIVILVLHGCHRHHFSKCPDFSLIKIRPNKYKMSDLVGASGLNLQLSFLLVSFQQIFLLH